MLCLNESELLYHPICYKINPCLNPYCNLGLICPNLHQNEQKLFQYGEFFRFDINTHKTKPCPRRGNFFITKNITKEKHVFTFTMNVMNEDHILPFTVMNFALRNVTTVCVLIPITKLSKFIILADINQNFVNHTPIKIVAVIINSFVPLHILNHKSKSK